MKSTVTHHLVGWAAAAVACALGVWLRASSEMQPDSLPLVAMIGVSFGLLLLGLSASRFSLILPDRISPAAGGVAIRYRRSEPIGLTVAFALAFSATGIYGFTADLPGPKDAPSAYWLFQAAVFAWLASYFSAHLPWFHRMVIRPEGLSLHTSTERVSLAWEDIMSIREAPVDRRRTNTSRLKSLHAAIAITIRPEARSPRAHRREAQLQDRFHIGYLAIRNETLIATLQHLLATAEDRDRLTDPVQARELFSRHGTTHPHGRGAARRR